MRIQQILHEENSKFDVRKRSLQRKEVADTYKKNASYTQANKNPMLEILNNLISGKTEKDIFENQESSIAQTESNGQLNSGITTIPISSPGSISKGEELERQIVTEKLHAESEIASGQEDDFNLSDWHLKFNLSDPLFQNRSINFNIRGNLNTLSQDKVYQKAVTTYNQQMEMSRKGYNHQNKYSISA